MSRCTPILLLAALFLIGCERPFVEAVAPTLEMVRPERLDTVRTETRLPLAFRASSFRAISRIEVNGEGTTYIRDQDIYLDTLQLEIGLNTIRVEAFDIEGTAGVDTFYAVRLNHEFTEPLLRLPSPRGSHSATTLHDGSVLIVGGAERQGGTALSSALRFDPRTFTFTPSGGRLNVARAGHTASLLPDGRVLILGGSTRATPTAVSDLAVPAEVYDPVMDTFTELTFVDSDGGPASAPILRTEHTTTLLQSTDGQIAAYLYGGLGSLFNGDTIEILEFIRSVRFDAAASRLVAIGPRERFRFTPLAGHTQTPLPGVGADGFGRYIVAGTSLPDRDGFRAPFVFTFEPGLLDEENAAPMATPRTDHAAAQFGDLVLVAGGRTPETQSALAPSGEVFAPTPLRFFALPDPLRPLFGRWSHTATNLGDGRILLVGGFSASGEALDRLELFLPR